MWIEKLFGGVLELETPIGPRFLDLNFLERVRLMWTFRHFLSLPQQVLRPSELRLIDRLTNENRFVAKSAIAEHDLPVIGRVERQHLPIASDALLIDGQRVETPRLAAEDGLERAT
ncbi:MAG: hypothetical protein WAU58_09730 [Terriglobales bacterium]|jgi:hypothetical protein